MWLEGRFYLEFLRLIRDPVFRGDDVPSGLRRPVLLIPGFLAGDWTLRTQFDWLKRVGYRPRLAGVAFNVRYSEVMLRPLVDALLAMHRKSGSRVLNRCLRRITDDLHLISRINRRQPLGGCYRLVIDDQRMTFTEFSALLLHCIPHLLALGGNREIGVRLVVERG